MTVAWASWRISEYSVSRERPARRTSKFDRSRRCRYSDATLQPETADRQTLSLPGPDQKALQSTPQHTLHTVTTWLGPATPPGHPALSPLLFRGDRPARASPAPATGLGARARRGRGLRGCAGAASGTGDREKKRARSGWADPISFLERGGRNCAGLTLAAYSF